MISFNFKLFSLQKNIFLFLPIWLIFILFPQTTLSQSNIYEINDLEKMIGQMIMVGFRGTGEDSSPASDLQDVLASIKKGNLGGVVLFDYDVILKSNERNIKSLEQIKKLNKRLQQNASIALFIAIDQEGGLVNRLKPPALPIFFLPSAKDIGKDNAEKTQSWGEKTGSLLKELGINVNFAPCVDVDVNPQSPAIGKIQRAFSSDALIVAKHAKAFAQGLAKHDIISAYKHFPGHGSATTDTHFSITDITQTWSANELIPYLPENRPNVPMMMMIGHLVNKKLDPTFSALLSKSIVTGLLRNTLKWNGVVVSDDMQMDALNKAFGRKDALFLAISAGVDILAYGNNLKYEKNLAEGIHKDIMDLVKEGKISPDRIAQSYRRIMELKKTSHIIKQF